MEITVAGAGAGKTTSMASKIVELRSETDEFLNVYCITFTNNAVACIENKLKEYYGEIPKNIIVSTIHSFLYREFIKPYYFLLYGKQYVRVSTAKLPEKDTFKAASITRLEDGNVLHQSLIPKRAKWILSKKTGDRVLTKQKRLVIKSIFKSYCGGICVDEAQDIDSDMLEILEIFCEMRVNLILMGDPKQDLKGHKCLRKMIGKYPDAIKYLGICHRCPQKHLRLSNTIVLEQEQQYSNKSIGMIQIYFEKDKSCKKLMEDERFDLSYISQKQGIFETHVHTKEKDLRNAIYEEIEIAMRENHPNTIGTNSGKKSYFLAERLIENYVKFGDKERAMNITFRGVSLKKAYGRIINLLPDQDSSFVEDKVIVNSIESIKGQEGNNCLFILTTDLAAYLFGAKTDDNATKNKLYVALTRSLNKLTIFITALVEEQYGREYILNFMSEYVS